jgi:shikimate dehydrogenase
MNVYGILGQTLTHSYSQQYFREKFIKENITDASYKTFEIKNISELPQLIQETHNLKGFNVTIPFKQKIIPFLDTITEPAKSIGAVNTVKLIKTSCKETKLIGYNTDAIGFEKSLLPFISGAFVKNAIILGTGGSAKAVAFVLKKNNIKYIFISRNPKGNNEFYVKEVTPEIIKDASLLINCSPVGMFPKIKSVPLFNYSLICSRYFFYDLVYNPEVTTFMKEGTTRGATVKNGREMLMLQAEESWKIWRE